MISLKNTLKAITTSIKALSVDYIVEQGTSGIWTYRKWNSGIAECWGTQTASVSITTSWWSQYYATYSSMPNYPIAFLEVPNVSLTVASENGNCWGYPANKSTKTNVGLLTLASMGSYSNFQVSISIHAIGKWK